MFEAVIKPRPAGSGKDTLSDDDDCMAVCRHALCMWGLYENYQTNQVNNVGTLKVDYRCSIVRVSLGV